MPDIDLFASPLNKKCNNYVSCLDPDALAINTFIMVQILLICISSCWDDVENVENIERYRHSGSYLRGCLPRSFWSWNLETVRFYLIPAIAAYTVGLPWLLESCPRIATEKECSCWLHTSEAILWNNTIHA